MSQFIDSIAGIGVVIGIRRSEVWTRTVVIIWRIASLGAATGGPITFSPATQQIHRSVIAIAVAVLLIMSGLLWYVQRITRAHARPVAQAVCF